jgi:hypothetical protein
LFSAARGTDSPCPQACSGDSRCINGVCICNPRFYGPVCSSSTPLARYYCNQSVSFLSANGYLISSPGDGTVAAVQAVDSTTYFRVIALNDTHVSLFNTASKLYLTANAAGVTAQPQISQSAVFRLLPGLSDTTPSSEQILVATYDGKYVGSSASDGSINVNAGGSAEDPFDSWSVNREQVCPFFFGKH